jgi:hypothetical protein
LLFASSIFLNIFDILAKFLPKLVPLFQKTLAIAMATLLAVKLADNVPYIYHPSIV